MRSSAPSSRSAGAHGIETPINARIIAMIHEIEEGQRPLDTANLDELDRMPPAGPRRAA